MTVEAIELNEIKTRPGAKLVSASNLDLIKDVKVKIEAYVGEAEISVSELFNLEANSVIKLNRSVSAPIDIVLDGKIVARGTLSAIGDNFGVCITEINNK